MNNTFAGILVVAAAIAVYYLSATLDALKKLNEQVGNVRYYLGEIEKRMQRVNDKLHALEGFAMSADEERRKAAPKRSLMTEAEADAEAKDVLGGSYREFRS